MTLIVLPLSDPDAQLALVGGKGAALARLSAAGLPVPAGFHVTTAAYKAFVTRNALQAPITAALADGPDAAARAIWTLFARADVPQEIAAVILAAYDRLGGGPVAVRSSATAEDLPQASFAGQQDTFLDVEGGPAVIEAVRACWSSLWTARAIAYRARRDIDPQEVQLAVVVQRMVPADIAGVLFTADPVTGARDRVVVNAVLGLGESLVCGSVDPQVVVLDRDGDTIVDRHGERWLDDATARELAAVGRRIERLFARAVDVEWAVQAGRIAILQARPITAAGFEEWNDSLAGDYLWTCANLGEAIPSVMTPATWSLVQIFMSETMSVPALGPHRVCGRIGGRFYLNLSVAMGAGSALGLGGLVRRASEQAFGRIPAQVQVPRLPMSRVRMLTQLVPTLARFLLRVATYQRDLTARIADTPRRCAQAQARIAAAGTPAELARQWPTELDPLLRDTSRMLAAGARLDGAGLVRVRPWLRRLVGDGDTNALLSGVYCDTGPLASLGPLVGLDRLARGEIDRADFLRQWGHRCPDEFEVSLPRPAEDPAWVEHELAGLRTAHTDVPALLARQQRAKTAALQRFRARHPRKVGALERRMARAATGVRGREAARSEVIRAFGVMRAFAERAGQLVEGLGQDVYLLSVQELLAVLRGDREPLSQLPTRRNTYRRYVALPAYPTLIRGHFDPFRWAANPRRRTDIFDQTRQLAPAGASISGFPGSAGVVEGAVRVLTSVRQGDQLQPGEILVTTVTNVGWTPLFPRAGAVVTDIGAPLSHAAIVARELGIPAVVGAGNATARLHTGDRVRVDGARGTVDLLAPVRSAGASPTSPDGRDNGPAAPAAGPPS